MRILVAEDDARLAHQIVDALRLAGYVAEVAGDGEEALFLGETEPYDAVILDLGLPELDGLAVLEHWRSADIKTPVLVLTARGTWQEKGTGLRAGADDYLGKPFEMEEMLARLEALLRRASGHASPLLDCGPVTLDMSRHWLRAVLEGRRARLTLRLPRARLDEALALAGRSLRLGAQTLQVGPGKPWPIVPSDTVYARLVIAGPAEERPFADALDALLHAQFSNSGVTCQVVLGRPHALATRSGVRRGFSVLLHGMTPELSLRLQEQGLGELRLQGCGIVVPYKSIAAV